MLLVYTSINQLRNEKKIKALIESSCRYILDFKRNRDFSKVLDENHIPTFAFHFAKWKRPLLHQWFPDRRFRFYPLNMAEFEQRRLLNFIQSLPSAQIMVWGKNHVGLFEQLENEIWYLEDGFIRSIQLGAQHTPPISLTIDSKTPYFDATQPSDLEILLSHYDFEKNPKLIKKAAFLINKMLKLEISKYNHVPAIVDKPMYGPKNSKRILVVGQVENDASIKYGCESAISNNDLIRLAARENPEAEIIYKPHPDILNGHRKKLSDPEEVKSLCYILEEDIPMAQAFESIDHVYTITSLAGFEALIRGLKVTTLGCPFYAGWGLTDDRQYNSRRTRQLTKEQLFAGAFMLYPKYYNYQMGKEIQLDEALDLIDSLKRQDHASV
ncbi:capsular polysaccharide biosynthesis protein [Advenella sp. FME57]|uniref:capsular polysaccharide export protein, LipB/KpsS family n=1 Tax=Advenella sp. FME57 TaxID=2742604 RepID=UPI00186768D1|nr:capsular polysaccharide biosynthesis protein [Advenella sp. FME57]